MKYLFSNLFLEEKDLYTQTKYEIDPFLLENNKDELKKIFDFYKDSNSPLLFANGFLGTGKAEIVKYSTAYLNDEVITLKYNCFNSTILDDILLAFFKEFRKLSADGIISAPKVKTDNFTERINAYFAEIEKPFVVILDSFEAILEENRQEILDFIFHIISTDKTKVLIIGRSYNEKLFPIKNVTRITTHALDRKIFDNMLKQEKIKAPTSIIDLLYQHTRGYYFYTILTIKIIQKQKITLEEFLEKLKSLLIPYTSFLEKELISLIPPEINHLFWFLILIRHDVSANLLNKLDLYNEQRINELIENKIVIKEGNEIYIQDYFDEITESAPQNLIMRLRQYLVDIYQSQLPLKPFERDICISRQTMRKEIEFNRMFLPKRPATLDTQEKDISYLSYLKIFNRTNAPEQQNIYETQVQPQAQNKAKRNNFEPTTVTNVDLSQRKNVSLNLSNFSTSVTNETNAPTSNIKRVPSQNQEQANSPVSFKQLIDTIKKAEKLYQYSDVLDFAQQALALKNAPKYKEMLPFIYAKMANAYTKTAQYDKALSYYNLLEQIFKDEKDKVSQIQIKVANIYYETYKFDLAKKTYLSIVQNGFAQPNTILNSYLKLINIAEENKASDAEIMGYFQKALTISKEVSQINMLTELYFKYALILDDTDNIKSAIEYYNKCIETDDSAQNKFLSSVYSNLAGLALEDENIKSAVKNYEKALEIDTTTGNLEGVYDSAYRLANIYKPTNPSLTIKYLQKAIEVAQKTNDAFYIITASLELGDYYYDSRKDEIALKYYVKALDYAKNKASTNDIEKINVRLHDIKFRLGEDNFNSLVSIINSSKIDGKNE